MNIKKIKFKDKSEIISVLGDQMREINNKVDKNTKKIDYLYTNFNIK